MKYLLIGLFSSLLLTNVVAQKTNLAPYSPITVEQQNSISKSSIPEQNHDYLEWKLDLPKQKKRLIRKNAIASLIVGILIGSAIAAPAEGACIVVSLPFGKEESCPKVIPKGAMIGGGLGLLIGLGVGNKKSKKIKFMPKYL